MPGVMSQIGRESNGVKRIFANKRNWGEIFGAPVFLLPQVVLTSSINPIPSSISLIDYEMMITSYKLFSYRTKLIAESKHNSKELV